MTDLGIPGVTDAELIASGGTALVYRAKSRSGHGLAIKVLRGMRSAEVMRRFERELSAAERLHGHPNIMRIHHTGTTTAGEPFLIMPLVDRGSLNDELERSGPFSLQQATSDVATAAQALEFAHQRGVLHRDIKPANLLRTNDGSIVVSDFGIARVIDAGISSATVGANTPLYAAPEVLTDNHASVRSEVYSLGALLYALLAGRPAFAGDDNIWATMNRVRTEAPPPIAGVPAPIMAVISQAMAKHPSDRPASAAAFRDNLRNALTGSDEWTPPAPTDDFGSGAVPTPYPDLDDASPNDVVLGPSRLGQEPALADPPQPLPSVAPQVPDGHQPAAVTLQPNTSEPPPRPPGLEPPPPPAIGRAPRPVPPPAARLARAEPAPPASHSAPATPNGRRSRRVLRTLLGIVGLAAVAAGSWLITTMILEARANDTESSAEPPIDTSLPVDSDGASTPADPILIDDLPVPTGTFDSFVSFNGDHFSALLPEGWTLSAADVDVGYGFRSEFVTDGMYLNIDTTPKEQRDPVGDIAQSARDIAANIASAGEVRTEIVDGLTMHSFTFRNSRGLDSIDIFFEVDGDGYAVVAGSSSDPDAAFATARLVALSIRSNPA